MPAVLRCPTCPICRAWIAPRAVACPSCHAQRQPRRFMSPGSFTVYAWLWLLCTAVLLVLALRIAAAPWLADGEPPDYALWLLGATEAKPPPACRIIVRDLQGHEVVTSTAEACDGVTPAKPRVEVARRPVDPQRLAMVRWMASGLHSAITLAFALLASWALRNGLRRLFRRPSGFAWVSRVEA
ncbi:hypothetical protein ACPWT1_20950 [Ramlibacter sp. MMS24-I3-19]|uniref:hypothetical protein n=1 Tax=Ramlibacter sp. MMS24-I3-19 TaxID=3416606 RepID=UPI003CFE1852